MNSTPTIARTRRIAAAEPAGHHVVIGHAGQPRRLGRAHHGRDGTVTLFAPGGERIVTMDCAETVTVAGEPQPRPPAGHLSDCAGRLSDGSCCGALS